MSCISRIMGYGGLAHLYVDFKYSRQYNLAGRAEKVEDLILELVVQSLSKSQADFEIKGKLITGKDLQNTLSNLGLTWNLKR